MKLRVVAIILLLSLLLFFGFKKVSPNKNKEQSTNIEQLSIIKYIPENNKLLFISNLDSFNIVNNNEKDKNPTNKDNFILIKDSILDYLGIDLGNNKLEDIYNNELIISTFENNKKLKDDILIVFKIKPEKTIDDLLNLPNKIDQIDEIISINRENKINFLNYIYRTDDNYIIASSDKKLIKNSINSSNDFKEKKFQYEGELLGLKNQKNILFTKKFRDSIFFNKEILNEGNEDVVATIFDLKNNNLILKSFLLNNKKNIDILTYDKLINKENRNAENSEVSIFSDIKNFDKYLKPLINDFELSFFEEFNKNVNQDILILNSKKDWLITFEKNTEDEFNLSAFKKLKDFNKYTLKQNEDIYSIYSKDILEEKDNVIKQLTYENIYSIESGGLQIISNYLIDDKKLETISKKFFNLKSNKDKSAFLYAKVYIKDETSNKIDFGQQRSGVLYNQKWNELLGTAKEGKIISKFLNADLLMQENATSIAIQKVNSPKILHIASHSYFIPNEEEKNPLLRSGIVLAGANNSNLNNSDDGYLTALEITRLNWEGTELVVISGCESGKGESQSGEGVFGLKRSISVAGASSSLLSLWKVDDAGTARFMESFYKKLIKGQSKADALKNTQTEFLNHPIPGLRHPYYWAAFQLSGDWKSLNK